MGEKRILNMKPLSEGTTKGLSKPIDKLPPKLQAPPPPPRRPDLVNKKTG